MSADARRAAGPCAALAVAALLVTGCTGSPAKSHPAPSSAAPVSAVPGPGRGTATPAQEATASPSGELDRGNPESVAAAYVAAYVRQSWRDADPRAFLKRIEPYATAAYLRQLRDSTGDRCDVTCEAARKKKVEVSAGDIETVIPDEAPRSDGSVWVQVSYTEHTSWAGGGDSTRAGMSLKLARGGGAWLVQARQGT